MLSHSNPSIPRTARRQPGSRGLYAPRRMRGFSMLETLVTLLVIAIWLLGSAGVQSIALKLNKSSAMRNQAVMLAAEIGERIENNRRAASLAGGTAYVSGGTSKPSSSVDCIASTCTPAQLAAFDLQEIYARADANSNSRVKIALSAEDARTITYQIVVTWVDRRTDQKYATTGTEEVGAYTTYKTVNKI